jgi:hypothetical protein
LDTSSQIHIVRDFFFHMSISFSCSLQFSLLAFILCRGIRPSLFTCSSLPLPFSLPPSLPQEPSKLTLKEVDLLLEEIAKPKTSAEGKEKMAERLKNFSGLMSRVNPREFKWLVS